MLYQNGKVTVSSGVQLLEPSRAFDACAMLYTSSFNSPFTWFTNQSHVLTNHTAIQLFYSCWRWVTNHEIWPLKHETKVIFMFLKVSILCNRQFILRIFMVTLVRTSSILIIQTSLRFLLLGSMALCGRFVSLSHSMFMCLLHHIFPRIKNVKQCILWVRLKIDHTMRNNNVMDQEMVLILIMLNCE